MSQMTILRIADPALRDFCRDPTSLNSELAFYPPSEAAALARCSTLFGQIAAGLTRATESITAALTDDPFCLEAHILLAEQIPDGEHLSYLREALFLGRHRFVPQIVNFSPTDTRLNPYVRLLSAIGASALVGGRGDVAVHAFEEILRIRRMQDSVFDLVIAAYLYVIGCARSHPQRIRRTWAQLHAVIEMALEQKCECAMIIWVEILEKYAAGDDKWEQILKAHRLEMPVIEALFLTPAATIQGVVMHPLVFVLRGWRDFIIDVHILMTGRLDPEFAQHMFDLSPPSFFHPPRLSRASIAKSALAAAEGARAALETGDPIDALTPLDCALHLFDVANRPADRWYLNTPPFVFDIAIAVLCSKGFFGTARLYVRMALAVRPQSPKIYAALPEFGFVPGATAAVREFETIAHAAENGADWRSLGRKSVALLSLTGLAFLETQQMTKEKLATLEAVGLEDLHTPINLPVSILPLLPWLTEEDCDLMA
jgi:hypothetical protein